MSGRRQSLGETRRTYEDITSGTAEGGIPLSVEESSPRYAGGQGGGNEQKSSIGGDFGRTVEDRSRVGESGAGDEVSTSRSDIGIETSHQSRITSAVHSSFGLPSSNIPARRQDFPAGLDTASVNISDSAELRSQQSTDESINIPLSRLINEGFHLPHPDQLSHSASFTSPELIPMTIGNSHPSAFLPSNVPPNTPFSNPYSYPYPHPYPPPGVFQQGYGNPPMHYYHNPYPARPYYPPAQNINPYQAWSQPYFQRPPMMMNPSQAFGPLASNFPSTFDLPPSGMQNRIPEYRSPSEPLDLSSPLNLGTPGLELDKSSEEGEGNILYGSDGEATDLIPSDLGIGLSSTQDDFVGGYLGLQPAHPYRTSFVNHPSHWRPKNFLGGNESAPFRNPGSEVPFGDSRDSSYQSGILGNKEPNNSSRAYDHATSDPSSFNIPPTCLPRSFESTPSLLPSAVSYSANRALYPHSSQYQANRPPYLHTSQYQSSSPQYQYSSPQQQAPNFSNPYSNSVAPQYPSASIPERPLARGHLAQARFHDGVNSLDRNSGSNIDRSGVFHSGRGGGFHADHAPGGGAKPSMPRPPTHSPHALWVGNVPSDALHQEVWRFFTSKSPPSARGEGRVIFVEGVLVDLDSTGVESVHLISRSNCAFVNYASDIHLQHAIRVTNGLSLRPQDFRCKDLICRVRKREEDVTTGVGAQRIGGMHHAYVARMETQSKSTAPFPPSQGYGPISAPVGGAHRSSSQHENSIASTSSSFLQKYFTKRFFVLKAHEEGDLKLSVERGLWTTQIHNEPILDQAYRTCKDGVYLIFSANGTGEWFGYGKMAGPISSSDSNSGGTPSTHNSDKSYLSSMSHFVRPATILEEEGQPPIEAGVGAIFSPREHRFVEESPLSLTPGGTPNLATGRPDHVSQAALSALQHSSLPTIVEAVAANLHLPKERKGESLDPKLLSKTTLDRVTGLPGPDRAMSEQGISGRYSLKAEESGDGVLREDTLPTAEERNARLERLSLDVQKSSGSRISDWSKPFKVEWIKVSRLSFYHTNNITNSFNGGKMCKVSRDGTEVEPAAGEALLKAFWRAEGGIVSA